MPTLEVFDHISNIKQREAYEKGWLLRIAVQPNCDAKDQKEGFAAAEKIGKVGRKAMRRSAYDVVDRESRIRMIGSSWLSGGERWAAGHPKQVEWLSSQGISLEQAKTEFEAWWDERMGEVHGEASCQPGEGVQSSESAPSEMGIIDFSID